MAKTMATPSFAGAIHCRQHGFLLRMDVALCRGKVAVASEIGKRIWVHVCRPARQAGVAEGIQSEGLDSGQRDGFPVLLLQARLLDVAAARGGRENPSVGFGSPPHRKQCGRTLRQRNPPACVLGFSKRNVESTIPHMLPT